MVIDVADSSTAVVARAQRRRLYLQSDPDNTENIRLAFNSAAAADDGLILTPSGVFDEDVDDEVNAIHVGSGGTQALIVKEF